MLITTQRRRCGRIREEGTNEEDAKILKEEFPWWSSGKTAPSDAEGVGLIPGPGTKIPDALQPPKPKPRRKQYCNKVN